MSQKNYISHYAHLKNKWTDRNRFLQKTLLEKHKEAFEWLQQKSQQFVIGSVSGLLLFSHAVTPSVGAHATVTIQPHVEQVLTDKAALVTDLSHILPRQVEPLNEEQEKVIGQTLSRHFGFNVSAQLQGKRLNQSYGIIGAEQHLTRYPGDTMETHFVTPEEAAIAYSSGMAPGRGAWGYFAPSVDQMSERDILREKYYIAVQTFLAPGYNENVKEYSQFFKFRKMLVVNPQNGKAVVAVIGDAGPAPWTGKHLGGSPEVMQYLERKDGKQRGPVLYFFVDDPGDTIPLGPVK